MKREEKNQQTIRKIMDSALSEFSLRGYGASSMNNICTAHVSKGIIYHYFDTKDSLFLACVAECFEQLTAYIRSHMPGVQEDAEAALNAYFALRMAFFQEHPAYQRIFCEAVMTPPAHLEADIRALRQSFEALNTEILARLMAPVSLRSDITRADVMETVRSFQDFINAHYQITGADTLEFAAREQRCKKSLNILLYGIVERKEL